MSVQMILCDIITYWEKSKSLKFIAGVNNTTEKKLFIGVSDAVDKFFAGVNDTADKTVLTITACLDLKMKNKQKFNLQE